MANISTDFSTWSATPASNQPDSLDTASIQADLQALQAALKIIFPNIGAALTPTHTELNYVDGVTSAIQTQLNAKAASGANSDITSLTALASISGLTSINGGQISGFRNAIINGNFTINQRVVSGTVTLSAGAYGHDRWKAGAGGCTYTFATSANVTTLTITAGTLMQVIEGDNLQSGSYKLSWTGTATARVDSGSYGASGIIGTAVGGTNQTIEFSTGTVSKVMYEFGSVATLFEHRPIGVELALCQRYFFKTYNQSVAPGTVSTQGTAFAVAHATINYLGVSIQFPQTMRIAPTITAYGPATGASGNCTVDGVNKAVIVNAGESSATCYVNNLPVTINQFMTVHLVANAEIA